MADEEDQRQDARVAAVEEQQPPVRAALSKAELGARMAAQVSQTVSSIFSETRRVRTVNAMQDLLIPRAPLSISGIKAEMARKTGTADATLPSPSIPTQAVPESTLARPPRLLSAKELAAASNAPAAVTAATKLQSPVRTRDELREKAREGIDMRAAAISYRRGFGEIGSVDSQDAYMLADLLENETQCNVQKLNLAGCVDVHAGDQFIPEHLEAIKQEIAAEYWPAPKEKPERDPASGEFDEEEEEDEAAGGGGGGAEDDEDQPEDPEALAAQKTVEKLTALLEKWGEQYTTYDAAITFLAKLRMRRLDVIFGALIKNSSVTELDLSENHLGAVEKGEEGRNNFAPLRKLGKLLDETTALRQVNLSTNAMGPHGVGIIAKAMTKNITIHTLDLDNVGLFDVESGSDSPAEVPDPEQEAEDPVFGEFYAGLEALSELLKKNKFLRVLSIRSNRIKAEADDTMGEWDAEDEIKAAANSVQGEETEEGGVLPPNPELIEEAVKTAEEGIVQFGADTQLYKFMDPFRKYHRIRVLDLGANLIGDAGAKIVASALEKNRSVEHLDLSDNQIGLRGIVHLTRLVHRNTTINTLILAKNQIKQRKKSAKMTKILVEHLANFSEALAESATITSLDISDMGLEAAAGAALLSAFSRMSVVSLNCAGNELCAPRYVIPPRRRKTEQELAEEERLAELGIEKEFEMPLEATAEPDFEALKAIVTPRSVEEGYMLLQKLNISGNRLGPGGAAILASQEHGCAVAYLSELDVGRNAIGDEGLAAIVRGITDAASSSEREGGAACAAGLSVGHNRITDGSLVGSLLRGAPWLQKLGVSHNRLGDNARGFVDLLDAVGNGGDSALRDLDVAHNNVGTAPAENEALVLLCERAQPPLTSLNFMDNPLIGIEDTVRALNSLRKNATIESLRISSAAGDRAEVLAAALACLQTNTALTDLDVCCSPTEANDEKYAAVKSALLKNAIARASGTE